MKTLRSLGKLRERQIERQPDRSERSGRSNRLERSARSRRSGRANSQADKQINRETKKEIGREW